MQIYKYTDKYGQEIYAQYRGLNKFGFDLIRERLVDNGWMIKFWYQAKLVGDECGCEVVKPYGWVISADCKEHD